MLNDKDCQHCNGVYDSKDGRLRCVDCLVALHQKIESVPMISMRLPCQHCLEVKTFTWDPIFKRYECPIVGCPETYKQPEAENLIQRQKTTASSVRTADAVVGPFRTEDSV